ncbi:MAG TPA: hypothetical protein VNQ99_17805 [Xanthobacteraceae bacterium]|nr:hypothetical protein [Xanthobacteraceae bacterium]
MRPSPFPLNMPEAERRKVSQQRYAVLMGQIGTLASAIGWDAAYVEPHQRALAECIQKLAGLDLHRIGLPAEAWEGEKITSNLYGIAVAVDPLIKAIGDEAASSFNIPAGELARNFEDQVLGALDGNATHTVVEAAKAFVAQGREVA